MGVIRYIIVILLPVLILLENAYTQASFTGNDNEHPSRILKITSENNEGLRLSYHTGICEFEKLKAEKGKFIRLSLPDHSYTSDPGKPQLPVYTTLLDYDKVKNARIIISDVVITRKSLAGMGDYDRIYPSQPSQAKSIVPQDIFFVLDNTVYSAGHAYITDTVEIKKIGIMRGKSIASLEIKPVIYHPAEKYVDIISSMNINIQYSSDYSKTTESEDSYNYYFDNLFSKGLINYDTDNVIPGFSLEPAGMVIVSDTSLKNHLQPLVKWKTKKGFRVIELYIGENGLEKDFQDIKDTLNYIYNNGSQENPAPTYLLLAGDLNYIPPSQGTNYLTDMYYAEFDGNGDFIPDMFTGRLPASDTSQLKAIVRKIIEYENYLFGDSVLHFTKAVAAAGYDEGHEVYMNGQVNYAGGYFDQNPYTTKSYIFNHESNDSIRSVRYDSLKALVNEGVAYINYTGHGNATSWLDTEIDYSFVDDMANESRYPVVISNACLTAKYDDDNCIGSSMVRAIDKGALAFIGCTNDSYWTEDYYWSIGVGPVVDNPTYSKSGLGFYDRLFHLNGEKASEWYTTTGQIIYAGNLAVSSSTSSWKQYYWETYVLLGDPSISPYIGSPESISVTIADSLPPTLKKLNLNTPAYTYVGLSHYDTLWDACHATPSGSVDLNIPPVEKDSCLLIMSRQNAIPLIKTIYFAESDTAWLSINDINVSDPSGNDNGKADYNETVSLKTDIQNAGNEKGDNVYLKISSNSEYINIIKDSLYIGTVEANTEILETGFEIRVADSVPDLEIAAINLELHYNGNIINQGTDISLHAPEPVIINCITDDTLTGNGNGLAEAGERIEIIFRLINNGSSSCSGSLLISNISDYIEFDATTLATGPLNPGELSEIPVRAIISENTPESTEINFDVELISDPYTSSKTLSIIAGKLTEDFELLNFTTFPWINNADHPWIITDEAAKSNMHSARSGIISHNEKSQLEMLLNIPEDDTLRFWYKVSSEASWDSLTFKANDSILITGSGELDWTEAVIPLKKGVYSLQWIYEKDQSVNNGFDCAFLDLVRFPAHSFVQSAINLNKLSSPEKGQTYDEEVIAVELTNLGRDTIDLLSMTYVVNDNSPVNETFNTDLRPGDTITLSFSQTADMSIEDTYNILVYLTYPENYFINDTLKTTIVSTGIEDPDINKSVFILAPNPVKDKIRLICHRNSEDNSFILFNSSGMMVYRKEIDYISAGEQVFLDPGHLSRGSYILIIHSTEKRYLYKVIKL
ncbi:MAG: C25 family cysteine peptidase [Bacteroidota bacterium]